MNTERLKKIRASKDSARRRQELNYQTSGDTVYYTKAKQYEELVEICDMALSVSRVRDEESSIKNELFPLAEAARKAEENCRGGGNDTVVVLNKIMQLARKHGWRDPRY